ncbi:MAG TPA: SH3 domain-containing protein, partial [Tepidiformaceae bacterium]|nr:SH3 domain-containing protein [Tepidiformaceae bacterium]
SPGEAVLRCTGCDVLHHPGCWVTNGGCATANPHESAPVAQAYGMDAPVVSGPAPHPGEGIRTFPRPPAEPPVERGGPIQFSPRARPQATSTPQPPVVPPPYEALPPEPPPAEPARATDPVIGADDYETPGVLGSGPPPSTTFRPRNPIPYSAGGKPPKSRSSGGKGGMPSMYRRHRMLAYWYIPIAILLAIGVAWGVVAVGDQFFGGDDTPAAAGTSSTPTPTQPAGAATNGPTQQTSPGTRTATTRPATTTTPSSGAGGLPAVGDTAVVETDDGECLNIRTGAGSSNAAVDCLAVGTEVTVTEGPEAAGGLDWVRVTSENGHDGWVALQYLEKK